MKEEKLPNTRNPSYWWVSGEFWNLRGQHNWEETHTHTHTHTHTQITCLTAIPSREVAQTLMSTSSEQELNRETQAACLG